MFSRMKKWLDKYTESKSASIPKYLGGKKSGAELNNMRREKQAKHALPKYLGGKKSGAELNNMRREKQAKHEDLLK